MASARVDVVREVMRALFAGDFEAVERLTTPDVAFRSGLAAIEGRPYEGPDGFRQYVADLADTFESFEPEFLDVSDLGEQVITTLAVHAVGRGSGLVVEEKYWIVFWFEDGLIRRAERFDDRGAAVAAAEPLI